MKKALLSIPLLMLAACASSPQNESAQTLPANAKTYDVIDMDKQPTPIKQAPPVYPFAERRYGNTGEVIVEFVINTSGKPINIKIVKASTLNFAKAAVDAIRQWRFKPGIKDGRPVNVLVRMPLIFDISS